MTDQNQPIMLTQLINRDGGELVITRPDCLTMRKMCIEELSQTTMQTPVIGMVSIMMVLYIDFPIVMMAPPILVEGQT